MAFIAEAIIEKTIQQFDAATASFDLATESLQKEQPVLLGFLFSESFEVFTEKERELMLYLLIIIYHSVEAVEPIERSISEKEISYWEELNWAKMQTVKSKQFRERLDVFFEDADQEDLLAFVEDMLIDEEEEQLTKEAREAIFISMKTIIDCLTAPPKE